MSKTKWTMLKALIAMMMVLTVTLTLLVIGQGTILSAGAEDGDPPAQSSITLNPLATTFYSSTGYSDIETMLSGTVVLVTETGTSTSALLNYKNQPGYHVNMPDLRPTLDEALDCEADPTATYQRSVSVTYTDGDQVITSNTITINVAWDKPRNATALSVTRQPSVVSFDANKPLTDQQILITLSCETYTRIVSVNDPGVEIIYQNGDTLQYGDTQVTIRYTDIPGQTSHVYETVYNFGAAGIHVAEEGLNTPQPQWSDAPSYTGVSQSFIFNNYRSSASITVTSPDFTPVYNTTDKTVTVSALNAGEYQITFEARTGYKFIQEPAGTSFVGVERWYKDIYDTTTPDAYVQLDFNSDPSRYILKKVVYTIILDKADLADVAFGLTGGNTTWTYDGDASAHLPLAPTATGVSGEAIVWADEGIGEAAVSFTYIYSGMQNSGTAWDTPDTMPAVGGRYYVDLTISGMANYKDYTTSIYTGDSVQFVIDRVVVADPVKTADPLYTGSAIAPTMTHDAANSDESLYIKSELLATNKQISVPAENDTYELVYTLRDPDNYRWASDVMGGNADLTVEWVIRRADNTLTLSIGNWTYGGAVSTITPSSKFGAGTPIVYEWQYKPYDSEDDYQTYSGNPLTDADPQAGYYKVRGTMAGTTDYNDITSAWVSFEIKRAKVNVPVLSDDLTYNATAQGPTLPADTSKYEMISGDGTSTTLSATDAGRYYVTFALKYNYEWSDSTARTYDAPWTIKRMVIGEGDISLSDGGVTTYDPSGNSVTVQGPAGFDFIEGIAGTDLTVSGATVTAAPASGAVAKSYSFVVTLKQNYCVDAAQQSDFTSTLYTHDFTWEIQRKGVQKPGALQSTTYSGTPFAYDPTLVTGYETGSYTVVGYQAAGSALTATAPTGAGWYNVTFRLNENYAWETDGTYTEGDAAIADYVYENGLVIYRAVVTAPTMGATKPDTYTGLAQTWTASGYQSALMSYLAASADAADIIGDAVSGTDITFSVTTAGSYTITFTLSDTANYTWSTVALTDPAAAGTNTADIVVDWEIAKASNSISATLTDTYTGWKYGQNPTLIDTLGLQAALDDALLREQNLLGYAYYDADDAPVNILNTLDVGSYYLVITYGEGPNTLQATRRFDFTITKNDLAALVVAPTFDDAANWIYGDPLSDHALSYSITIGDTPVTNATIKYYTLGWNLAAFEADDWTGATEVTTWGTGTPEAGYYKVIITVDGGNNHNDVTTEGTFTIQKQKVNLPIADLDDRLIVHQTGMAQYPALSTNAIWSFAYQTPDSTNTGNYWVSLTLSAPNNYEWNTNSFLSLGNVGTTLEDYLDENDSTTAWMWYRITFAEYTDMDLTFTDFSTWVYGDTRGTVAFNIPEGTDQTQIQYQFFRMVGGTKTPVSSGYYQSIVWPTDVGQYYLSVTLPESTNFDFCTQEITFTITQRQLTPIWNGGNAMSYVYGTAADATYAFGAGEVVGSDDLGITMLYGTSAAHPVNVGEYTVTITLGNGNYCFAEGAASATADYDITKADLIVTITPPSDNIYNGSAILPTYGYAAGNGPLAADAELLQFVYTYYNGTTFESAVGGDPTNVGTYCVEVTFANNTGVHANYNLIVDDDAMPYTIEQRQLTPTWNGGNAMTYVYGTATDATYAFGAGEVIVGDDLGITISYGESSAHPVNFGEYTVTITLGNGNYCFAGGAATASADYKITKATLTLTPTAVSTVYGTAVDAITWNSGLAGFTVTGWVLGDEPQAATILGSVTYGYTAAGYAAGSDVGTYDLSMTTSLSEVDNYILVTAVADDAFTVTPRPIIVEIPYQHAIYETTAEQMLAQITSALRAGQTYTLFGNDGDDLSEIWTLTILDENGDTISGIPAHGTYRITGVHNAASAIGKNYAVTFWGQEAENGTYTQAGYGSFQIGKKTVTFQWVPGSTAENYLVYDGTGKSYTLRDTIGGITFAYTYTGTTYGNVPYNSTTAPTEAGTYTVSATISNEAANNYEIAESHLDFTIMKATYAWVEEVLGGGFAQTTYTYNGTTWEPKLREEAKVLAGADGIAVQVQYSATVIRDSGTYPGYTASFVVTSSNYNAVTSVTTDIVVNPYTLTSADVTWQSGGALSFIYNGQDQLSSIVATYVPFDADGQRTGTPVALTVGLASTGTVFKNVGENYAVSVTAVADPNYTLGADAIQAFYAITRYAVELKAQDYVGTTYYGNALPAFAWEYIGTNAFFPADAAKITISVGAIDAQGTVIRQGSDAGSYYTYISNIEYTDDVLYNYTINGKNGESWTQCGWKTNTELQGSFAISQRVISLNASDVSLPNRIYWAPATQAAQVLSVQNIYEPIAGQPDMLGFVYTYEGVDVTYAATTEAPVNAGKYRVTITLAAPSSGNKNANYAFASSSYAFEFTITAADLVTSATGNTGFVYNGKPYFIRQEDIVTGANTEILATISASSVNNQAITWAFSLQDLEENPAATTITSLTEAYNMAGDAYTIYYKVSAPNHKDVYGHFEVTIARATNSWTQQYTNDGWAYKGDGTTLNPAFPGLDQPTTQPTMLFGDAADITYTYYLTRTDDGQGGYTYSDPISDPDTFFSSTTNAGTYYVHLEFSGNKNYTGLEDDAVITVAKHTLLLSWELPSVTADETSNTIHGFDPSIMQVVDNAGLTLTPNATDLELVADLTQGNIAPGVQSITIQLFAAALDNYCWDSTISTDIDGVCKVSFTISQLGNVVVITVSNTWMYGDVVTTNALTGNTPATGYTVSIAASSALSVNFSYAPHAAGVDETTADTLTYTPGLPTAAGEYWLRVEVTGDAAHGNATGYAKFTIAKRLLTDPTAATGTFTYDGTPKTYLPQFGTGFTVGTGTVSYLLPNGTTEIVATIEGDSYVNAGSYTASVTLQNANYAWVSGATTALTFDWSIGKAELSLPIFAPDGALGGSTTLGTTYDPAITYWLLNNYDPTIMTLSTTSAPVTTVSGNYALSATNAATYILEIGIKTTAACGYNYYWAGTDAAEDGGTVTLTWTIAPVVYKVSQLPGISFISASKPYNGTLQALEITGTLPAGLTVSYSGGATNVSEGGMTVTATFAGENANYTVDENDDTLTATITITPVTVSEILWSIEDGFAYDGTAHTFGATFKDVNATDIPMNVAITLGDATFKNAGSYTFTATIDDENYVFTENTTTRTILPRVIDVTFGTTDFTFQAGVAQEVEATLTDTVALGEATPLILTLTYSGQPFGTGAERVFATGTAAPIMAGNYSVTVTLANDDNGNYVLENNTLTFVIAKAHINVPTIAPIIFNNELQTAPVTDTADYTVDLGEGAVNAGTYTVELSLTNPDDYTWFDGTAREGVTYDAPWSITPATSYTITLPVFDGSYVYDATSKKPTTHASVIFATGSTPILGTDSANAFAAPIRYAYAKVSSASAVPSLEDFVYDRPTGAGIYKVMVYVPATQNYAEGYSDDYATLVIQKANYNMSGVDLTSDAEFTYDGRAHVPALLGALPVGLDHVRLEIDGYTFKTESGSPVDAAIEAGKYTVTVTFTTTSPNYNIPGSISTEFTITVQTITSGNVHWEVGIYTYNGTDQIGSVKAYFINAEGEREYFDIGIASFEPAGLPGTTVETTQFLNAGTYVFTLLNTENDNYIYDEDKTLEVVMAQSEISVEIGGAVVEYNGREPEDLDAIEVTVTTPDSYFGDELGILLQKAPGSDAGTYAITIASWTNGNYRILNAPYAAGAYVIEPRAITVELTLHPSLTFDGTQKPATWTIAEGALVEGDSLEELLVTLLYSGEANDGLLWNGTVAPVKAGDYTVAVDLKATNYVLENAVALDFTIARAAATIDVSGILTEFTYDGKLHTIASGALLNHAETSLVYTNNTFTTVAEGNGLVVTIRAAQTPNYEAAEATVTLTVHKAAIAPGVTIQGWIYGNAANAPTVTGTLNAPVTYLYTGTSNGGTAWNSANAPTLAGAYTLTIKVAETDNYAGAEASATFTIARAASVIDTSGVLTEYTYTGETQKVESGAVLNHTEGSLTYRNNTFTTVAEGRALEVVIEVAQTDNYEGARATVTLTVHKATLSPSVQLNGWTFGQSANTPTVNGTLNGTVAYRYTGTTVGGAAWDSAVAPTNAGSYTLTITVAETENHAAGSASVDFAIAKAKVEAPTLGDTGEREHSCIADDRLNTLLVTGFDSTTMSLVSARNDLGVISNEEGKTSLVAMGFGTFEMTISLKDTDNYEWTDGDSTDPIALCWTVEERVVPHTWQMIVLAVVVSAEVALLVILLRKKRGGKDGNDGDDGEVSTNSILPAGTIMLLTAVPTWQLWTTAILGIACVALAVVDVVLLVNAKKKQ